MNEDKGLYICYERKPFSKGRMELLRLANLIIAEYESNGIPMSIRQLHYQLTSRDPEYYPNTQQNYNRLVKVISDGRVSGLVSWTAIVDRNRFMRGYETFNGPIMALRQMREDYKMDLWQTQDWRPVFVYEKAALEGVIGSIAGELRVDHLATRGYNSQSEQWRLAQRLTTYIQQGQRPIVFDLRDHDPSGLDMTEDNRRRLELFANTPIIVQRLALNWDQVQKYNPPPNFAKDTDSRFESYRRQFNTTECWEMDALDPAVLQALLRDAVMLIRDEKKWGEALAREVQERRMFDELIEIAGGSNGD